MNKKTTIAFEFFNTIESNSNYNFGELLTRFLEQRSKNTNGYPTHHRIFIKNEIIRYFDYLYGLKQTFPIFIEWVVRCGKMHIPNNTIFTFRDLEWMRQGGLTWTEILMREGVRKPIKWVYKDNQVVEIDYSIIWDGNDGM